MHNPLIFFRNLINICELYIEGGKNMRTIMVEPDRLERVAANIESLDGDYNRIYQAMYDQVDKIATNWKGKDNAMFTNQIKLFEDDLRNISAIMRQYADFLRSSARSYRQAQDEIYMRASKLKGI